MNLLDSAAPAISAIATDESGNSINADITSVATGYFGCVEELQPQLRGWVVHAGQESEPITVDVLLNGERAATAYCVLPRADIAAVTGRSNRGGFAVPVSSLKLPASVSKLRAEDPVTLSFCIKGVGLQVLSLFQPTMTVAELRALVGDAKPRQLSMTEIAKATKPYLAELRSDEPVETDVKLIAFYLPQYHPVPENDEWWGRGFTEWTNVTQGKPQFPGHHQPHVPAELGYYDLRVSEVREAQARLAREHGIEGFCYYYYWFNGRRILERPLQEMLDSGTPDLPFCICWANETWSRRWDGSENEVLLKQEHTPESDVAFIHDVIPILKDPRYIRVNGAPLLMVYRASLFPDLRTTADTWRRICAEEGIPAIHLCVVESFGFNDPHSIGFDSSVQFPPHGVTASDIHGEVEGLSDKFAGKIYDYEEVVANEVTAASPVYRRFPGVMLSWDNTARRKERAHIFANASPELYEVWLRSAAERAKRTLAAGERFVFINAWNEWAEGTHLEPDARNGSSYLEATLRVSQSKTSFAALMDHARKASCLQGDDLASWLKEVESRVEAARLSQEQAMRIVRRNHSLSESGSILSLVEPYVLSSMPMVSGGRVFLERINGLPAGTATACQRRDRELYLEGWCTHPDAGLDVDMKSISYLVFDRVGGRQRYYAPVFGRATRRDVVAALPELPEAQALYSGFRVFVDASDVEPGEYRIGLLQASRRTTSLTFVEGVIRVS